MKFPQPQNDRNPFLFSPRSALLLRTSELESRTTHRTLDKKPKDWSTTGRRSRVSLVDEVSRVYRTASEVAEEEAEVEGVEEEAERSRFRLYYLGCIITVLSLCMSLSSSFVSILFFNFSCVASHHRKL